MFSCLLLRFVLLSKDQVDRTLCIFILKEVHSFKCWSWQKKKKKDAMRNVFLQLF